MSEHSTATDYYEPARSYCSIWYLGVILTALFCVDVALGSAVDHLPGWIIGAALVLGVDALVVHAARVTKSLSLTADELRVGEEAVDRAEIVSASSGSDSDLPVLGWPNGMPRAVSGIVVRFFDGKDVTVPTRYPGRLLRALALAPTGSQDIRDADATDYAELADIAARSDALFRMAGHALPDIPFDVDEARNAKAVFVAGRPAIAFVQVDEVDGNAHISEIAVVPKFMRQHIGTRLAEHVCEWSTAAGYPAVTLTTYADIPWNGPWYAKLGFEEVTEIGPKLQRQRQREVELGLDDVARRIAMRREL